MSDTTGNGITSTTASSAASISSTSSPLSDTTSNGDSSPQPTSEFGTERDPTGGESTGGEPITTSSGGSTEPVTEVGGTEDPTMGGFAAMPKYGITTTTGGSAGRSITVASFDDLKAAAESNEVLTIQIEGTISAPTAHEVIRVQSNKTLIGLGATAKLNKLTLSVNSWNVAGESCEAEDEGTFVPASNVIIRNLEFIGLADFPDDSDVDPDAIRVECYSHHVWIDHNTFQYGADGSTDVKRGADMVTLSFNHYVKTAKTALIGHSDSNGAQDTGRLNVTFHHNFFDQTETRTPRVRFGYAHVYNNYYDITNHVFRIGPGGKIYAEGNTVVSTEGKILTQAENEGSLTWTDTNVWDHDAYGEVGGERLDADQTVERAPYEYSISAAPTAPPAAGVGKL